MSHGSAPASPGRAVRIGLTGGIGSGKSTVAAHWVARGAALVDTDRLAHALTAPGGAAMPAIAQAFGTEVVAADGALDRAAMRARVFADAAQRQRLEGILHPLIGTQALAQAQAAAAAGAAAVLFDVPLLAESAHWRSRCDRILVVDCREATQVARVMARSGWPRAQAQAVVAQQASRAHRRAIADAVVHNDDGLTVEGLAAAVAVLWQLWVAPSR